MTMSIHTDAKDIKTLVRNAEALGDEFLSSRATLKIKILAARLNPEVVPHDGRTALLRLAQGERDALSSMTNLFRVHNELSALASTYDVEPPPTQAFVYDDASVREAIPA